MASVIYGFHRVLTTVTIASGAAISSTGGILSSHDAATDGIMDISKFSWASVQFPAAWTAADVTFWVAPTRTGTFLLCYDKAGAILRTIPGSGVSISMSMPGEVFQHGLFLKLGSTNTASAADVNQGAARILTVVLGS